VTKGWHCDMQDQIYRAREGEIEQGERKPAVRECVQGEMVVKSVN